MIQNNIIDYTIFINKCKAFFILSVAFAHCPIDALNGAAIVENIWQGLGTIGVVGFFILSGFWLGKSRKSIKDFFRAKIKTIIIPWFFCGTAIYIVTSIGGDVKTTESFTKDYPSFIIGNGSLYYYLTVLLICYIILWGLRKRNNIVRLLLFVSPISILFTQIFSLSGVINPYLNVLNWISFLALGIYIGNKNLQRQMLGYIMKYKIAIAVSFILLLGLSAALSQNTYFHFLNIFTELFGVATIAILSLRAGIKENILSSIGKVSFPIYLVHIPLAGLLNIVFADCNAFFLLAKPFIVVILTFIFLHVYETIVNRLKTDNKLRKVLLIIMGIRG